MKIYHATTHKKAKHYADSKRIISPVRGFDSITACMAWAMGTGRTVIMSFNSENPHKLPDHHNKYGTAYWNDGDVLDYVCEYSGRQNAPVA